MKTEENVTPMPISQAINLFTPLIMGQNYTSHPAETVLLKVRPIFVVKGLADHSLDLLYEEIYVFKQFSCPFYNLHLSCFTMIQCLTSLAIERCKDEDKLILLSVV